MKYCDTNFFINAILGDKSITSFISRSVKGEFTICTSSITWDELVWALKKSYNYQLGIDSGRMFLNIPKLIHLNLNKEIINNAQNFIEFYKIRPKDAIHVATALANGITEIISDDSDFDKVKEIKRVSISEIR